MLKVFLSYRRIILVWNIISAISHLQTVISENVAFKIKYSGVAAVPCTMNTHVVSCTSTLGIDFALAEAAAATNCSCRRSSGEAAPQRNPLCPIPEEQTSLVWLPSALSSSAQGWRDPCWDGSSSSACYSRHRENPGTSH